MPVARSGTPPWRWSALADAGADAGDPRRSSRRAVASRAKRSRSRRLGRAAAGSRPGGWAFEFANDNYPDIDDTAEVVLALRRGTGRPGIDQACRAGSCLDRRHAEPRRWMGCLRRRQRQSARGQASFLRLRRSHGSPLGRRHRARGGDARPMSRVFPMPWWPGVSMAVGAPGARRLVVRALGRQLRLRDRCRGAGPDRRRSADRRFAPPQSRRVARGAPERRRRLGRGPALLYRQGVAGPGRLHGIADRVGAAGPGCGRRAPVTGGRARYRLALDGRRADGSWDEPWFTGTGFPWDFSINYHLYRLVWPLMALGRYTHRAGAE